MSKHMRHFKPMLMHASLLIFCLAFAVLECFSSDLAPGELSARDELSGRGRNDLISQITSGSPINANQASGKTKAKVGNHASIVQSGSQQQAIVAQQGNENFLSLSQIGLFNQATLTQTGQGNQALVTQNGSENRAFISQQGALNTASIEQNGHAGLATITQHGHGSTASIIQH